MQKRQYFLSPKDGRAKDGDYFSIGVNPGNTLIYPKKDWFREKKELMDRGLDCLLALGVDGTFSCKVVKARGTQEVSLLLLI